MIVKIYDKEFEYQNGIEAVEVMFSDINRILEEEEHLLQCLTIDGVEISEDHFGYIEKNLNDVKLIEVVSISRAEGIAGILQSGLSRLDELIKRSKEISGEFYRSSSDEMWKKMSDYIGSLQEVFDAYGVLNDIGGSEIGGNSAWLEYSGSINSLAAIFGKIEEGIRFKDTVLVGDTILHEIKPLLGDMCSSTRKLLNQEVCI